MKELAYEPKNIWENADDATKKEIMAYAKGYKAFLNSGVTERKCAQNAQKMAEEAGFEPLEKKAKLCAGDKVYMMNRNKNLILARIGSQPVADGVNIVAAHIDVPRLDLKPVPFFEETEMAYLKTHYYGGIKKYQWTAMPLGLCGVVSTKQGEVEIDLGDEEELCFCISDLLPHLAGDQMKKTLSEAIEGEKLNLIIGSIPGDAEKYKVKQTVLEILNEKYGICEEDFISAELEAYPAFKARDVGLDRSMVGGFGQDDRVCGYTALTGLLNAEVQGRTAVCVLADKEEVGSMGNTGMKSMFFQNFLAEMLVRQCENYNDLMLRRCLSASICLSADVSAAYDPAYDYAYERRNTPFFNKGLVITKYTGSRGKGGSSDASAEFVGKVRRIFDENGVAWQTGELGKIDVGGGGTVAQYIANLNVDVVDCGVALLSMHSPFEVAAKADIYMAYKGYRAFYSAK